MVDVVPVFEPVEVVPVGGAPEVDPVDDAVEVDVSDVSDPVVGGPVDDGGDVAHGR